MLASRHKGIEIINATMVTHKELKMNAQKPYWFSEGDQSEEKIKLLNEWLSNNPEDLNTKPAPIPKGKTRKKLRHTSIHFDERESISFRFVILHVL